MLSNTIYRYIAVICISCFHLTAAQAANVVIGQVAELTGQSTTTESMLAANMWFAAASKKGPHTYEIKSLDDKRDPVLTVSLTKQLIEQGGVQALFGYRSTPSLEALSRELASLKVPLVAPFNGAASVRQSAGEWGFFLRASYRDEAEKLVRQVGTIGISNIAIVHQQDPFGMEGLAGFQAALAEQKLKPSTVLSYDRKNLDVKAVIEALNLAQPSAVFMACTAKACAEIIKTVRLVDKQMMFLSMSNIVTDEFVKDVATVGRNVVLSQVVPHPWNQSIHVVKQFHRLNSATGNKVPVSYSALEGFLAAKLLTEAANRAGKNPTAKSIKMALQSMRGFDLGGVKFDATKPPKLVELTLIGSGGRLIK